MTGPEQKPSQDPLNQEVYRPTKRPTLRGTYVEDARIVIERPGFRRTLSYAEGVHKFGPPQEYFSLKEEVESLLEASLQYDAISPEPARNYIQERLGNVPHVVEDRGTYNILTKSIKLLNPGSKFVVIGPCFPNALDPLVERTDIIYERIPGPLNSYDEAIELAKEAVKEEEARDVMYYYCVPSSPTGDLADIDNREEFIKLATARGFAVFEDGAQADFLDKNQSAWLLTNKYPNLIVSRSTVSKGLALPGLRYGYAAMSEGIGEDYKHIPDPFNIPGMVQYIANRILDPKIVDPYMEDVIEKTRNIKRKTVASLDGIVDILHTHPTVPILTLDGGENKEHFASIMQAIHRVEIVAGSAFSETHPEMTDRYVRITIPGKEGEIEALVKRIKQAALGIEE